MRTLKINPSTYFVLLAGIALLISLPFLSDGNLTIWITAKVLYVIGTLLFIFNK